MKIKILETSKIQTPKFVYNSNINKNIFSLTVKDQNKYKILPAFISIPPVTVAPYPIFVNSGTANQSVIMNDGRLIIWGSNSNGQITGCKCLQQIDPNVQITISGVCGYGLSGYTSIKFSQESGLKPIQVDTSDTYTAVLLNNGKIYIFGELLKGSYTSEDECTSFSDIVTQYPNDTFIQVSATSGFDRILMLKNDGNLTVWKLGSSLGGTGGITLHNGIYVSGWNGDELTLERVPYYNAITGATHSFHNYKFKYAEQGEWTFIGIMENDRVYVDSVPNFDNEGYSAVDSLYNPWLENTFGISSGTRTHYFKSVSSSQGFNAGVSLDGVPSVWGSQNILSGTTLLPLAWSVHGITAIAVDCGTFDAHWLMANGTVESRPPYQSMPNGISLDPSFKIKQISVGDSNVIALSSDNKIYVWGNAPYQNSFGQSGLNNTLSTSVLPDIFL